MNKTKYVAKMFEVLEFYLISSENMLLKFSNKEVRKVGSVHINSLLDYNTNMF